MKSWHFLEPKCRDWIFKKNFSSHVGYSQSRACDYSPAADNITPVTSRLLPGQLQHKAGVIVALSVWKITKKLETAAMIPLLGRWFQTM